MSEVKEVEVRQGLWIDERWLRDAGLGRRVQVIVEPGEIRIVTRLEAITGSETSTSLDRGWNVFRSLGNDAPQGRLVNAAIDHDRYLYKKHS